MPTLAALLAAHLDQQRKIVDTVIAAYSRYRDHADPAIYIALRPEMEVRAEAERLQTEGPRGRRLWGIPVAVKDNIDVAGLPTTAACPAFAYHPTRDSSVVARLRAAGAIIIGKTNLDQFATGLNGTRSPYGVPRNTLRADLVPGGSSSGSACAVASGIVPIALGTDTAGSGRIPAGLQNIVGLKPSVGLFPSAGVVPACRTLDCVSIFGLTVDDAWLVAEVLSGIDADDPFSRDVPIGLLGAAPPSFRLGVPREADLDFDGDGVAGTDFQIAVQRAASIGATIIPVDMTPFNAAAKLLYEGPWIAERYLTIKDLLERDAEAILPIIRTVIAGRPLPDASVTFAALYEIREFALQAQKLFKGMDAMMVPTMPRSVTLEEMARDPVGMNSLLGRYTNFVNLLDLCALAVPVSLSADGTAAGVTFIAPCGRDAALASIGRVFHAASALTMGATGEPLPQLAERDAISAKGSIEIVVVGAHLSGMPLNYQLTERGGAFIRAVQTTEDYRLYALPGGPPFRPGLLQVEKGTGAAIAVEVWALPAAGFGQFVDGIPAPLGIGTLKLSDGATARGFIVEALAVKEAVDISHFGGWRAYMSAKTRGEV